MKWFKHYSGAVNSEALADLIRDTGFQGYGRYFRLLEHLAGLFDGESISFRIPIETVRGLLRIRSWTELGLFTERLSTVRGLDIKRNGNVFEIEAAILLELQDRDFKKARIDRGDSAPKNKNKNKNKIKNKDIDLELDKEIIRTPQPLALEFDLESLYEFYPLKKGKTPGLKKLSREIKTQSDFDNLKKAVLAYAEEIRLNKTPDQFIKHFSTFVNQWRDWVDFIPSCKSTTAQPLTDHVKDQYQRLIKQTVQP